MEEDGMGRNRCWGRDVSRRVRASIRHVSVLGIFGLLVLGGCQPEQQPVPDPERPPSPKVGEGARVPTHAATSGPIVA
jgi:hypothetical protein